MMAKHPTSTGRRHRSGQWHGRVTLAVLAMVAAARPMQGQRLSGAADIQSEAYGVQGRNARRPGLLARTTLSPVFDLWGLQVGATLTYDTEDRFSARSLNRYALAPRWSWGQMWLGDHAPNLGAVALDGAVVRGAGLSLTPGRWRIKLHGGRADDAVFTDPLGFGTVDDRRFNTAGQFTTRRGIGAALLGFGTEARHLELLGVWAGDARDVPATAPVAPQQNVVGGVRGAFEWRPGWRVRGTWHGAIHTRDLRDSVVDASYADAVGPVGRALDALIPLRASTRGDVAYSFEAEAPHPFGTWRVKAEQIGAGYVALGIPSLPNNWRNVEGGGTVVALGGRATLSGMAGIRRDGLVDPGAGPTDRLTGMLAGNLQATEAFSLAFSGQLNRLERRAVVDTFGLVNVARAAALAPRWQRGQGGAAIGLTAAYTESETRPGILAPFGSRAVNLGLTYDQPLGPRWTLSVAPSLVTAGDTTEMERLLTASATLTWRPERRSMGATLALSGGQSLVGENVQLQASWRSELGPIGALTARLRAAAFMGAVTFRETQATLGLSRSW